MLSRALPVLCLVVFSPLGGCLAFGEDAESSEADDSELMGQAPILLLEFIAEDGTELLAVDGNLNLSVGLNVTFDASGSSDPDGTNVTFLWDFGDGENSTEANVTRSYEEEGEFNLTLTVTDEANESAEESLVVFVSEPLPVGPFFYDGAEDPTVVMWTFESTHAGWHPAETYAAAGTVSWAHQDEGAGGYHDNEETIMESPLIDLGSASSPVLRFKLMGSSETDFDFLYWDVAVDGDWDELGTMDGTVDDWVDVEEDLAEFAGMDIQIRFRFESDASCSEDDDDIGEDGAGWITACDTGMGGDYRGWFLDEITVAEAEPAG